MLKTLSILVVSLALPLAAHAIDRDQSFICEQKLTGPRAINCCDTLPGKSCEETQSALLDARQIGFLGDLTEAILGLPAYKTGMPSCFATSMVIAGLPIAKPFEYSGDRELIQNLKVYYEEIYDTASMRKGDVIVFDEQGEFLFMDDDELGHKHYHWGHDTMLAHAMYYLGDGLVVQKENAATAVSTISTLDRALKIYGDSLETTQHIKTMDYAWKKTKLVTRVYRLLQH